MEGNLFVMGYIQRLMKAIPGISAMARHFQQRLQPAMFTQRQALITVT